MGIRSIWKQARTTSLTLALLLGAVASPFGSATVTAQDSGIATRVQFLHAGPDLGDVEVHINGANTLENFAYGDQSDWVDLDPGSVQVTVTEERAGFNYVVFDVVYPVPAGNEYFAVLTDDLILAGTFDTSSVVGEGSSVQFMHASVDTPPVDITATGDNLSLATQLGFARASVPAPMAIGTYELEVTLSDSGESVLTVPGVVIDPSKSYVMVLTGVIGDTDHPLALMALETDLNEQAATPVN
jgi:hypothetical protein